MISSLIIVHKVSQLKLSKAVLSDMAYIMRRFFMYQITGTSALNQLIILSSLCCSVPDRFWSEFMDILFLK